MFLHGCKILGQCRGDVWTPPLTGSTVKSESIHSNQLLRGVHTMKECNVIAIDLAKDICQVCIVTARGKVIFNKAMNMFTISRSRRGMKVRTHKSGRDSFPHKAGI